MEKTYRIAANSSYTLAELKSIFMTVGYGRTVSELYAERLKKESHFELSLTAQKALMLGELGLVLYRVMP